MKVEMLDISPQGCEVYLFNVRGITFTDCTHHITQGFTQTNQRLRIEFLRAVFVSTDRCEDCMAGCVGIGTKEGKPSFVFVPVKDASQQIRWFRAEWTSHCKLPP
jgi:hypothetical protein